MVSDGTKEPAESSAAESSTQEGALERPWTQEQVARLSAEQRRWLQIVESHDRKGVHLAVDIIENGLALRAIRDSQMYKELRCSNMDQFCNAFRSIRIRQASKHMTLSGVFTTAQLQGKIHNVATLMQIMGAGDNDVYRDALVDLGSGHTAGEIAAALRMSRRCESIPLGLAVIAYLLSDGPRPAEMDELEEQDRADKEYAHAERTLSAVPDQEAPVRKLLADPDLDPARRQRLATLGRKAAAALGRLGLGPEPQKPPEPAPPPPAGPKPHTAPLARPAAAKEPVADRPAQPDTGPPPETPHQRNLRLCAPYQPQPWDDPGFEIEIKDSYHWPQDWYEQWIEKPVGPDPILLCADGPSPQRGTLGHTIEGAHRVSLNLNVSFGGLIVSNPGGGKTYACNVATHMAVARLHNANELPSPLCVVASHYHEDEGHEPEALMMRYPNDSQKEISYLVEETRSIPEGHEDIVLLCFAERVERMRRRHPHVQVYPLLLASKELTATEIESLLGIEDLNDDRLYVQQLRKALRGSPFRSVDEIEDRLLSIKDLQPEGKRLVTARFALLRPHICDEYPLGRLRRPGRILVVDGRDPTRSKDDALTMMNVATSVLLRREEERGYSMLWRIDELHEFLKHKASVGALLMRYRKRRHLGLNVLCATQYPKLVPAELLSITDLVLVGRTQDEEALRYLSRSKSAFEKLKVEEVGSQPDGEMWGWSEKVWVDPAAGVAAPGVVFAMQVRSQNAKHGGQTRCAVPQAEGEGG